MAVAFGDVMVAPLERNAMRASLPPPRLRPPPAATFSMPGREPQKALDLLEKKFPTPGRRHCRSAGTVHRPHAHGHASMGDIDIHRS